LNGPIHGSEIAMLLDGPEQSTGGCVGMAKFSILGALALIACAVTPAAADVTTREAQAAAQAVSAWRQANGLPPVSADARLNRIAAQQTAAMVQQNVMSHDAGGDFRTRVRGGGVRGAASENLAVGTSNVSDTIALWKSSYKHNVNMLTPEFRKIGLARGVTAAGQVYWTLMLAE
jgi:uncharacterized protein YkwD